MVSKSSSRVSAGRFFLLVAGLAAGCGARPAPVQEGYISGSDGARIYWRSVSAGPETVLVPMGFYLEEALAPLAEPGRRLVFYDARGRGRSEAGDRSRITLDTQIEDLEALRAGLGIDRMALIGWSGLGMEMAVYAMRHPERVTRLIQVAPVPPRMQPHGTRAYAMRVERTDTAALGRLARRRAAGELPDDVAYCRERARITLPASLHDPAHAARVPDTCAYPNELPDSLSILFTSLLGSFGDYDWLDRLSSLTMPRLVIHGADDAFPVEGSREWVDGQPNARLVVVERAGHFPFLERPEEVLALMDAFLEGR